MRTRKMASDNENERSPSPTTRIRWRSLKGPRCFGFGFEVVARLNSAFVCDLTARTCAFACEEEDVDAPLAATFFCQDTNTHITSVHAPCRRGRLCTAPASSATRTLSWRLRLFLPTLPPLSCPMLPVNYCANALHGSMPPSNPKNTRPNNQRSIRHHNERALFTALHAQYRGQKRRDAQYGGCRWGMVSLHECIVR